MHLFLLYVCECLPTFMYVHPGHFCVCGGQKRKLSPLELELQMVLSHQVGARYQTGIFNGPSSTFNCRTISSALFLFYDLVLKSFYS